MELNAEQKLDLVAISLLLRHGIDFTNNDFHLRHMLLKVKLRDEPEEVSRIIGELLEDNGVEEVLFQLHILDSQRMAEKQRRGMMEQAAELEELLLDEKKPLWKRLFNWSRSS